MCFYFFFFHAPATTEIYTLPLHDALPIYTEVAGADVIATSTPSQTNVFASILRFLHLVRMRRGVIIGWMLVCLVIGAIFYAVAPRLYDSTAQIFVIRNAGGDARDEQSGSITEILKTLPTHARNMASQTVLSDALQNLPPEYRVDFGKAREQNWPDIVRSNLRISYDKNSTLIDLRYRSLDPVASKEMLNAIVAAYQRCGDRTSNDQRAKDLAILRSERDVFQQRILARRQELARLWEQQGVIALSGGDSVDVDSARILELESALSAAQQQRRGSIAHPLLTQEMECSASGRPADAPVLPHRLIPVECITESDEIGRASCRERV